THAGADTAPAATASRQAPSANASNEDTPYTGSPSAQANVFAVVTPIRTPVYDPGPQPAATARMSRGLSPAASTAASISGSNRTEWFRSAETVRSHSTSLPSTTATVI